MGRSKSLYLMLTATISNECMGSYNQTWFADLSYSEGNTFCNEKLIQAFESMSFLSEHYNRQGFYIFFQLSSKGSHIKTEIIAKE